MPLSITDKLLSDRYYLSKSNHNFQDQIKYLELIISAVQEECNCLIYLKVINHGKQPVINVLYQMICQEIETVKALFI